MLRKLRQLLITFILTVIILSTILFIDKKPYADNIKYEDIDDNNAKDLKLKIIDNDKEAFNARISLINQAETTINMCTYNLNINDKSAKYIIYSLIMAAQRNVRVNLIVDAKFSGLTSKYIKLLNSEPNIKLYLYNPINFKKVDQLQVSLHNKIIQIDNKWIISGGRNISDTFLNHKEAKHRTCDLDVIIKDKSCTSNISKTVTQFFNQLITSSYNKTYKKSVTMRTLRFKNKFLNQFKNYDFDDEKVINNIEIKMYEASHISLLYSSLKPVKKKPIIAEYLFDIANTYAGHTYVLTPYLIMNKQIKNAIIKTSNLKMVTLLTNSLKSSPNFPAFSNYLINRKQISTLNINIYEYIKSHNQSIHTKAYVLADDICAIGSMNLDNRSLYINSEQMILVKSKHFYAQLQEIINEQINNSVLLQNNLHHTYLEHDKKVPLIKKALMRICSVIFKPFQYFL